MKKILMFCIFLLCVTVATHGAGYAAAMSLGATCDDPYGGRGATIADRGGREIDCMTIGLGDRGQQCYLYCNDGTLEKLFKTCKTGFYALEKHPDLTDIYKGCGTLADACSRGGGRMNGTKCDCGGLDYEWSDTERKCVESENSKECKKASNASWSNDYGCTCLTLGYSWNWTTHRCEQDPTQAECEDISDNTGTIVTDDGSEVEWNVVTNKCECTKDSDGNDIANPDDYYVDALYRCVKKEYVLRREGFERNKPGANAKQGEIEIIIGDLKRLSEDMGKSHWKNASGGFNTARLASDSVAGVVLGTVGGVITSNVIKKNQVKGGFEDLNCTVGGQRVAGYSDEFNVGIQ